MYFSIFMLEIICYHNSTLSGPNPQEIVNFLQFSLGPQGPIFGIKFKIYCEFGPLRIK